MRLKIVYTLLFALVALVAPHLSAADLKRGEWSVRLILTSDADDLEDPYNTLGQLRGAAPGPDDYDLPELGQTRAGTYLSVMFYRPDWAPERETYNTDFHPVARKKSDEWAFEVRSDDPYRDLSLTWAGEGTKMKRMVLVDLQEDIVFPAVVRGKPQVYNFRMNGTVREFAWRVMSKKEYRQLVKAGREERKAERKMKKSNWLPKGWGQGEGRGHRRDRVSQGLPDDPFGD